jgi:hypothetical protein
MNEQAYARLFIDLAIYRLPDGTEAQAIWTGNELVEINTQPAYWIIVPCDNPADRNAWHQQYEVQRDGSIIRARYAGELPPDGMGSPRVEFNQEGYSDLSVDDFQFIRNPWENASQ